MYRCSSDQVLCLRTQAGRPAGNGEVMVITEVAVGRATSVGRLRSGSHPIRIDENLNEGGTI